MLVIIINDKYHTNYQVTDTNLRGVIVKKEQFDNRLSLIIKGKERVLVNHYYQNDLEKITLEKLQLGDTVKIAGSFTKPNQALVFGLFDYQKYLKSQKIYWLFRSNEIIVAEKNKSLLLKLKNNVAKRIDNLKYSKDYVNNYLLNKRSLDDEVANSYKINGTFHLLAISGAHVAFLVLILKYLKVPIFVISLMLLFYLFLTDFATSLTRASLFLILLQLNKSFQLNIKNQHLLIFLALALLIYHPFYLYDIGFQFSFIISFFLIEFSYLFKNKTYLQQLFLVSLIAFIASFPITINNFFEINLLAPLINLFFVPFFTIIIYPLAILTFFFSFLDNLLYHLILMAENISIFIAQYAIIINLPKPALFLFFSYYLLVYLVLKKPKSFYLLIITILIHKNIHYFNNYPIITFIDVNQGDAILIELPNRGGSVLIDTGGIFNPEFNTFLAKQRLIPYFKSRAIPKIDLLILTHGHYDHLGEAIPLLKIFPVEKVFLNSGHTNEQEQRIIDYLNKINIPYQKISKKTYQLNQQTFHFLNQVNQFDENEDSLVLYLEIKNHKLLLMGDAGHLTENYLMKKYELSDISILKVGHHGSRYSTSEEFISEINPKYAVITVGANNRFNHPHQTVIDILENHQVQLLKTSKQGSIKMILKEKIELKTILSE